jgi:beta propeller repeat protein
VVTKVLGCIWVSLLLLGTVALDSNAFSVEVEELVTGIATGTTPVISDKTVLYEDFTLGTYRFYTVDVTTKTKTELRNNQTNYLQPYDFCGTHAGWLTYSKGGGGGGGGNLSYAVQVIDCSSKTVKDIVSDGTYRDFLAMDNQTIIWTDYRHSTAESDFNEVYLSPLGAVAEKRITSTPSYKASLDITDNLMVWQDYRNAGTATTNADIYLYNISGGVEQEICTNNAYQDHPSVNGNFVVWSDFRNAGTGDNADIYLYDLAENRETAVCTAPGYQAYPKVSGDYIVWHDYRNKTALDTGNADIYLYKISTGTELVVTDKPGYQGPPSIYGSKIVWYDYTDGKLYMATIKEGTTITVENPLASIKWRQQQRGKPVCHDMLGKRIYSSDGVGRQVNRMVVETGADGTTPRKSVQVR